MLKEMSCKGGSGGSGGEGGWGGIRSLNLRFLVLLPSAVVVSVVFLFFCLFFVERLVFGFY